VITLSLDLDDSLNADLDLLSAGQGRPKADVVKDILRQYVETERLKRALQDPALAQLYQQLAAEDTALAEEGLAGYQQLLTEADRP
jgi:hypothetical protein